MEWICTHCRRPIADGDGYIAVDSRRAWHIEGERRKLDREHEGRILDGNDIWAYPKRVEWFATHRGCDPDPGRADYWFDVARCRTLHELLDWNRHINGKTWGQATNWDQFILDAAS